MYFQAETYLCATLPIFRICHTQPCCTMIGGFRPMGREAKPGLIDYSRFERDKDDLRHTWQRKRLVCYFKRDLIPMEELLWRWLMRWIMFLNLIFVARAEHTFDLYFAIKARMGRISERFPNPNRGEVIGKKPIEKAKELCSQFSSIQLKNQCTVLYIRYKLFIDCREKVMEELSKGFKNVPNVTIVYYDKDTIEDYYGNISELEGICFYKGIGDYEGSFIPQRGLIEESLFPPPSQEKSSKNNQKDIVILDEDIVYAKLLEGVESFVMDNIRKSLMNESTVFVDHKKRDKSNTIKTQAPLETVIISCKPVNSLSLYKPLNLETELAIHAITQHGLYKDRLDKELEKCIEIESSYYKNLSRENLLRLFPDERPVFTTMCSRERQNWWIYQTQFMSFIKIAHKLLADSSKLELFALAFTDYNFLLQAAKILVTVISTTSSELENYFYEPYQKRLDKIQIFLRKSSYLISAIKFEEPQHSLKTNLSNSKKSRIHSKKPRSNSKKSRSNSKKSQDDLKIYQPRLVFNDQKGYANQFDVELNIFSVLFQNINLKNAFIRCLTENDLAGWDRAYQTGPIPSLVTLFCDAERLGALLLIIKSPELMKKVSLAEIISTFDKSIELKDGELFHDALAQLNILIRHLDDFVETHYKQRKNIKIETTI